MDERLVRLFVKRDILTGRRKVTLFGWLSLAILAMLLLAILIAAIRFARGGLQRVEAIPLPTSIGQPSAPMPGASSRPAGDALPVLLVVWKSKDPLTGHETYDAPPEVKACVKACCLEQFRAVAPRRSSTLKRPSGWAC